MIGIIFEVFVWIIEISLVLVAIFFHWVEERNRPPAITGERDGDEVHVGGGAGSVDALLYRLHDLEIATNYFSDDNKLGKGGFGVVYKGLLDGQTVAVKKLYGSSVELDFLNEVSLLSSLKHNNLIKLLGFCCEARNFILVYEYALNGDLYHYLIDENKRQTLNWEMRLEIIKGFARGLSYLHHDSKNPILHRDIKPANVLLDEHHCAKIADFDLLRAFDTDETHKTTKQVAGTRGYIAPELFFECHVSTRSDVYSYGILVLETLAGCTVQKYAAANSGDVLSHVVWKQWKEKKPLTEVIDSYLRDTCPQDQLMSCITIGLLCVQEDPRKRPNMKLVLKMLNNESPLPAPSSPAFYKGITLNPSTGSGSGSDDPLCPEGQSPNLRVFTFAELRSTTKNFSPDTVLGEGGAGRIYKGWVDEKTLNPVRSGAGLVIAVKKLNPESLLGLIEWQLEVHFLGRLSHPNLVRLLGYCWEDKNLFLVYEFVPKGSLANHLFRRGTNEPLSWDLRIKIATGAARALTFLHTSERQVIHRDFKSSHILLDSNYNAKLCDFCLAKLGPTGSDSYVSTRVMGTYGYAAPEYIATGHLSVKSDVYGFGVVLLEMLSGQRVIDRNRPSDQQSLVDWAKPLLSGRHKLVRLMDPELEGEYPLKAALEATDLALKCVASEPKNRPSMKEVVEKLEHIEAMKGATSSRDVKKAAKKDWLCVFN